VTRSPLAPIFLIVLVDILSLTIMIPLLPFYADAFGASAVTVGLLFAVFSLGALVSGPVLGNLSDRYGRRPLLLLSQAGMLASLLVLAFATELWMLFLGRIISGITAGNLTIAQAYITDHTRPDQRTRAFGVIGIAFGLGFAVGPAISGLLSSFDPATASHAEQIAAMSRPLLLAAGLSGLSIVATATLLGDDRPRPAADPDGAGPPPPAGRRLGVLEWRGYLAYFRRPQLAPLLLQFFLFSVAFAIFITGFALYAQRRFTWDGHPFGSREVGYVYAYAGVLGIIIQGGLLRRLSQRFGDPALVIAGFAFSVVGYVLLGVVGTIALLLVATTINAFGHGFVRPALTARITHVVDRHEQGVVLGLTQSLHSLAAVIAPPLGNLLIDHDQLFWWAITAAVVSAIALSSAMAARREPPAAALPGASPPG
jgi:MFS transporter, DHA1 family, tetracycline resistance protein